jgi:hypothetical protein
MTIRKLIAVFAFAATVAVTAPAGAATLIDGATQGFYNNSIGTSLNGTSAYFPTSGDPVIDIPAGTPIDLSAAAGALGDWLTTPSTPGGSWSGLQSIPANWIVGTETAIIYAIDGGLTGLSNVVASFGIDNGIMVWLNGAFLGGHLRPGGPVAGEFTLNIGNLGDGMNFLQILREDHGGSTGYSVSVTGDLNPDLPPVPLPASALLLLTGLGGLAAARRRRA